MFYILTPSGTNNLKLGNRKQPRLSPVAGWQRGRHLRFAGAILNFNLSYAKQAKLAIHSRDRDNWLHDIHGLFTGQLVVVIYTEEKEAYDPAINSRYSQQRKFSPRVKFQMQIYLVLLVFIFKSLNRRK